MSRYSIWIAQARDWPHARMFVEVGEALAHALRALGHEVAFAPGCGVQVENPRPWGHLDSGRSISFAVNRLSDFGRSIILAPNFLVDCPLAEDAILFNFEQVPATIGSAPGAADGIISNMWAEHDVLKLMRRHTVWDYSGTNVENLKRLGVERAHHCRVGYATCLTRIAPVHEDIDVLFYGTLRPGTRRARLLEALKHATVRAEDGRGRRPIRVVALSGVYGEERDERIARARIVLNVHNNPPEVAPSIWEVVRCSYLLANKKCVVSEDGGVDPELEVLARRATVLAPYDRLVETCVDFLDMSAKARFEVAERGFKALAAVDQAAEVTRALSESGW